MSRVIRRCLHAFPEAPEFAASNVAQGPPTVDSRLPQIPKFTVKGMGSLLEVQLPASVELNARRNVLRGVLGSAATASSVASRLRVSRSPLLNMWGRQPVLQQKVVGTTPLTCLVGSNRNEVLSALELDGSLDWVLRSPIHAYAGRQLQIVPRSGWRPGSAPFAHSVVSGRGLLSFATPSPTVQLNVPEGETIVVAKSHLNAFTVDTNAAHKAPALTNINFEFQGAPTGTLSPVHTTNEEASLVGSVGVSRTSEILNKTKTWIQNTLKRVNAFLIWALRSGNLSSYVEIHGPSTVIVSAAAKPPRTPVQYVKST